jgi:GH35 family endo-1,4-beta-xylanase
MFLDDDDIDSKIENIRKGTFTIKLVDDKYRKQSNIKIEYKITRLDFDLGTVLYWSFFKKHKTNIDCKRYLKKIDTYFNTVIIPIFWHRIESEKGNFNSNIPEQIWQWCYNHGKATIGHSIFYGYDGPDDVDPADWNKGFNPIQSWIRNFKKNELKKEMKMHLRKILKVFHEKIYDYTLSNEMIPRDYYTNALGLKTGAIYFKWAKHIAPKVNFYVNENSILSGKNTIKYIEMINNLIQSGAEIGTIGIQGHFFEDRVPNNSQLWMNLEQFTKFNLPIKITEFGVRAKDEEQYALDMKRFYRVCFAHPFVNGIVRWGIWEPEMWPRDGIAQPEACLWEKDWSTTFAGEEYIKLVKDEWNTIGTKETDSEGQIQFRGFFGTYQLTIDDDLKYTIKLTPDKKKVIVKT